MGGIREMLADIQSEVVITRHFIGRSRLGERVMRAMAEVPREEFVPVELRMRAFDNGPLPIGRGQTISQPYIVALMTDLLEPRPEDRVLEVGTGSGYQAAVLATLVRRVYTMEIIPELARAAEVRLRRLGYTNVEVGIGDAYHGWTEQAPFDGILVTAAAPNVPLPLLQQLRPGAKLVLPIGPPYGRQDLVLISKNAQDEISQQNILGVAFVPLTRQPVAAKPL